MTARVLIDTSALVASFNRRDQHHEWAAEIWKTQPSPLVTCEAVLTEACFLVAREAGRAENLIEFVHRGAIRIGFTLAEECAAVVRLMHRYRDVPMSLADACLVRMSEQHPDCRVWTLDADFRIYRRNGRQVIPLMMPNERR